MSSSIKGEAKCPFHFSKSSVAGAKLTGSKDSIQFEEAPLRTGVYKLYDWVSEGFSRISFSSLKNAWYIHSQQDFNSLLPKICRPGEPISDFRTPAGTQYVVRDHGIMQLILSQFRNEEKGHFFVPENERLFIDGMVKDLYPEELAKITDREKEVVNAVIFTAESAHIHSLRARIMGFLKQRAVQEYRDQLDRIAGEILDQLSVSERQSCDPALLVYEFAITVMCRLFTGYQTTRENYQKVVHALLAISKHIGDGITRQSLTEREKIEYKISLQAIRDLIEDNVRMEPVPSLVADLRGNGLSEFAIKIYLFFFYLAGTETTSAVTHYLLLQLGMEENRHYQTLIREEGRESMGLKRCIVEALRLHPPAFILGRALRHDVMITIRDSENSLIWSKRLRKGHYIVNWIAGAGRHPEVYVDPEVFNPLRFETIPAQLPWFPFTTGPHTCPGQFLARAEMESLSFEIFRRFNAETIWSGPIDSKGTFTLHADPNAKIKMRFIPHGV